LVRNLPELEPYQDQVALQHSLILTLLVGPLFLYVVLDLRSQAVHSDKVIFRNINSVSLFKYRSELVVKLLFMTAIIPHMIFFWTISPDS